MRDDGINVRITCFFVYINEFNIQQNSKFESSQIQQMNLRQQLFADVKWYKQGLAPLLPW